MSDSEQIAYFLATRGATKVGISKKTIRGQQMARAIRGYDYKTIEQEEQEKTAKKTKKKH